MSSNLHWRTPNPDGQSFGYELKFALRDHFGDGYIGEWTQIGPNSIPFLQGVIAGAGQNTDLAREAKFLIDKIEKHGSVEVREVN